MYRLIFAYFFSRYLPLQTLRMCLQNGIYFLYIFHIYFPIFLFRLGSNTRTLKQEDNFIKLKFYFRLINIEIFYELSKHRMGLLK